MYKIYLIFYYALPLFADITFLQLESLWQPCTEQVHWHYFPNSFCSRFVCATFRCVLSLFSHVCLCVTLWTIACQAPLSMGFSRQECFCGLPWSSPGDLPDPGIDPRSSALQEDSLPSEPPGTSFTFC